MPAQLFKGANAGKGPVGFDRGKLSEQLFNAGAIAFGGSIIRATRQRIGTFAQGAPPFGPQLDRTEIIAHRLHETFPLICVSNHERPAMRQHNHQVGSGAYLGKLSPAGNPAIWWRMRGNAP